MKHIVILISIAIAQVNFSHAQSMKEKLKNAKTQISGGESTPTSEISQDAVDQYGEIEKFLSGSSVFKITQRPDGSFYHDTWNGPSEPIASNIKEITRTDDKVVSFSSYAGMLSPGNAVAPIYFKDSKPWEFMVFINGRAYHLQGLKDDGAFHKMMGIYTIDKSDTKACPKWDKDFVKTEIDAYFAQVKPLYDAAVNDAKANVEKAEAEKRAKNTIVGKDVSSLKIECGSNGKVSQGSIYNVVVIASLKDGSKISTADGGYSDEYEISATGLPATYKDPSNFSMDRSSIGESTISVPDVAIISGDKIVLTVRAKHNPQLTATINLTMDYSGNVDLKYNADMRSDRHVVVGGDLRIEVKKVKHAVSNENLLEYKVYNGKNELLKHFRIAQTSAVSASVNGQNGWGAMDGTPAMNGTNGGNVKVIVDPSVDNHTLTISNKGGLGGKAGHGYPAGINGEAGNTETLKQKVNW